MNLNIHRQDTRDILMAMSFQKAPAVAVKDHHQTITSMPMFTVASIHLL
jgi:hypothetical protein